MNLDLVSAMQDDALAMTRDLIRIDSSNWGSSSDTVGEAEAADYCAERLRECGWDPEVITTTSDTRRGCVTRIPGSDPAAPALVLHGHLDVVPAVPDEWTHPPFAAVEADGCIWGRGAVDMKNMDAMILAVARRWGRTNELPRRDIIVCFFPDEEAGMVHGSQWMVDHRPDLFVGASEAIGEVGGFSVTMKDGTRMYPVQTAEKGIRWIRLRAERRAGHGSMIHPDNAVTHLAETVARIGRHEWPRRRTKTTDYFLEELSRITGRDLRNASHDDFVDVLGTWGHLVGATLRNTTNPTQLQAGVKVNVIPRTAHAEIDGRFLPGFAEEFDETFRTLVGPDIAIEAIADDIAVEAPYDTLMFDLMTAALQLHDPTANVVPYMISGGTDAKALSRLGIACYGFSPLQMPPDLDYWRMFHGVDERVPIEGIRFGVTVLYDMLMSA